MPSEPSTCPSCGAPASGRFCRACGAALASAACPSCGTEAPAGAAFCARCGTALGSGAPSPAPTRPGLGARLGVVAAAAVVIAALGILLLRGRSEAPAPPTQQAGAVPPDISRMTPNERFDRLYRRVMQAARTGDTTATGLAPMALGAYEMLDSVTADQRYHAALIKLHLGDAAGARALGDSILARDTSHLLGYVARGMAYRWEHDTVRLKPVYDAFRRHAAAELARGRPEYTEHAMILQEFRQAAEGRPAAARAP